MFPQVEVFQGELNTLFFGQVTDAMQRIARL